MNKQFENYDELRKDPIFQKHVQKGINELIAPRLKRKDPKQGTRYKRDWYDRFGESNFNVGYFIKNIWMVWDKTSTLNSESRKVLKIVCNAALENTFKEYEKIEEPETVEAKEEPETVETKEVNEK